MVRGFGVGEDNVPLITAPGRRLEVYDNPRKWVRKVVSDLEYEEPIQGAGRG